MRASFGERSGFPLFNKYSWMPFNMSANVLIGRDRESRRIHPDVVQEVGVIAGSRGKTYGGPQEKVV